MWLARWNIFSRRVFSGVSNCCNSHSKGEWLTGRKGQQRLDESQRTQSGCWSVSHAREGHQTQAAPESWCSLKDRFPRQSPISGNTGDIEGLQQQLDTFGIHRQLLSEEQPSSGFISAAFSARTQVSRPVRADVQQDGTQVGEDVFFGHVELWKGNILSFLALGFVLTYWAKVCLTAYLTLMWSHNETYRGNLGPDVTFALN